MRPPEVARPLQLKVTFINGHLLSNNDLIIRDHIHELMCQDKTTINSRSMDPAFLSTAFSKLRALEKDDLVKIAGNTIKVTKEGRVFIRNICAAIDLQLFEKEIEQRTFSNAI